VLKNILEKSKNVYKPSFENLVTTVALVSGIFLGMKLIASLTIFSTGGLYGLPIPIETESLSGYGIGSNLEASVRLNPWGVLINCIFWYLVASPILARGEEQ